LNLLSFCHDRTFAARVVDYQGALNCRQAAAESCITRITHAIVVDPYRNRIAVPLERAFNVQSGAEFPFEINQDVRVSYVGVPNDPVRFHQERLSQLNKATISILEPD
jgi:hypothetical protein